MTELDDDRPDIVSSSSGGCLGTLVQLSLTLFVAIIILFSVSACGKDCSSQCAGHPDYSACMNLCAAGI
jgi:hypothetical protein